MDKWTDWPSKSGFHWFYGVTNIRYAEEFGEELIVVMVVVKSDGDIVVHRWSEFLYKSQMDGKFSKMEEPELPL